MDYQHGFAATMSFAHLMVLKKASLWLHAAGDVALHEKDSSNAWNHLEAGLQLVRKGCAEPLMIDHLVRIAIMQIQLAQTWRLPIPRLERRAVGAITSSRLGFVPACWTDWRRPFCWSAAGLWPEFEKARKLRIG